MIKYIFDRYYLVLLRHYDNNYKKDRLSYKVPSVMSLSLSFNLVAISTLIFPQYALWLMIGCMGFGMIVIMPVLDVVYNKKRREKLREEYEDEDSVDRRWAVVWVGCYEVLTVVLLVIALAKIAR